MGENSQQRGDKIIRKKWLLKAFSNDIFTLMTWFLFVLINQAKYYAQYTGNQYSILGRHSSQLRLILYLHQTSSVLRQLPLELLSKTFEYSSNNNIFSFVAVSADSVPSSKTNIFQSKLYTLIYCRHFRTYSRCTMFD